MEAAKVYAEFVASFDNQATASKTFVRGDVLNEDSGDAPSTDIDTPFLSCHVDSTIRPT